MTIRLAKGLLSELTRSAIKSVMAGGPAHTGARFKS
jgi:hypothetical protein